MRAAHGSTLQPADLCCEKHNTRATNDNQRVTEVLIALRSRLMLDGNSHSSLHPSSDELEARASHP